MTDTRARWVGRPCGILWQENGSAPLADGDCGICLFDPDQW
jgi:hypothetical protein